MWSVQSENCTCRILITLFSDLSRVPERLTASFLFNRSDIRNHVGISGRTRRSGALFTSANSQCQLTQTPSSLDFPQNRLNSLEAEAFRLLVDGPNPPGTTDHRPSAPADIQKQTANVRFTQKTSSQTDGGQKCFFSQLHSNAPLGSFKQKMPKSVLFPWDRLGATNEHCLQFTCSLSFHSPSRTYEATSLRPSVSRVFLLVQKGLVSVLVLVAPLR